jgi:hypothetical protein
VTIWDRGGLVVEDFRENEKILFELSGNKMQGRYALIKTKIGGGKSSSRQRSVAERRTRTGYSLSENKNIRTCIQQIKHHKRAM